MQHTVFSECKKSTDAFGKLSILVNHDPTAKVPTAKEGKVKAAQLSALGSDCSYTQASLNYPRRPFPITASNI
eukprot:1149058-Pelagomonas_calceolata.AAC.1